MGSYRQSGFKRNKSDAYYTEHWITETLIPYIPKQIKTVWEPAAGRGDISKILEQNGYEVFSSDINESPEPWHNLAIYNFLSESKSPFPRTDAIITNPPFGDLAVEFLRKALLIHHPKMVAMLLRSDWKHAASRKGWFTPKYQFGMGDSGLPFSYEIALTRRPRWDRWWEGEKAKSGGMHNFTWYVWLARELAPQWPVSILAP